MNSPVEVTQQFFGKVGARDLPAILALFADRIDWLVPGDFPWSGPRMEKHQIAEFFEAMWPYTVAGKNEVLDPKMIVSGNDVAFFGTFRQTLVATGKTVDIGVACLVKVEGGKIVQLHMVEDTLVVSRSFFEKAL